MSYLKGKKIVVTGGMGFLGRHLVPLLEQKDPESIFVPKIENYDLRKTEDIIRMYEDAQTDILIHLAAVVGGIGANRIEPGRFFYENAIMGIQLLEYGRQYNLEKIVILGTICAYPKYAPVPFKEEDIWAGYPEETNAPYGLAKKMLLVQSQAYRQQYGFNSIFLLPVNMYGPGDNFAPEISHVVPAIIKKCVDAAQEGVDEIIVWGTGKPTREFLYVGDAAEAIVLATEKYNDPDPVNIGSGIEISIKELVEQIAEMTGFKGKIIWDRSKPDGQPRRLLDTTRAYNEFGFKAQKDFKDGLKIAIDWYRSLAGNEN